MPRIIAGDLGISSEISPEPWCFICLPIRGSETSPCLCLGGETYGRRTFHRTFTERIVGGCASICRKKVELMMTASVCPSKFSSRSSAAKPGLRMSSPTTIFIFFFFLIFFPYLSSHWHHHKNKISAVSWDGSASKPPFRLIFFNIIVNQPMIECGLDWSPHNSCHHGDHLSRRQRAVWRYPRSSRLWANSFSLLLDEVQGNLPARKIH